MYNAAIHYLGFCLFKKNKKEEEGFSQHQTLKLLTSSI